MNNAPFHVGQKVVCVKTHDWGLVVKGKQYTVESVLQFDCCGRWAVKIRGVRSPLGACRCGRCDARIEGMWFIYTFFAPITPRSVSIPESLKEQAEEMISVKETIKEPKKQLAN